MANETKSDALFRMLIASVKDYAIFMLDPTGRIATWNAGAQRIKGYTADEIIGSHFSRFYPPEDVAAGKCEMELRVAARDGRFEDEDWRVRNDGSRFWANVIITAIYDDSGAVTGFAKVTRDLTDRKHAEDDRARRIAAEEANRIKDEFLAMLGHELRNPLAPILTAVQLMKLRGDDRREVQIIERQVRHMHRLVDDLLDVSRIVRGNVEIHRRDVEIRDVLAKALEIAMPVFEKKHHQFELHVPSAVALAVSGDEARLVQVFANLLNNAGKYTPDGGRIDVTLGLAGDDVEVTIADNGKGIAPDLLPHVFDLFVQARQNVDRPEGGLGLGLTLVRSLVGMHGGRVEARSDGVGRGAAFTVGLPAAHAARAQSGRFATDRLAAVDVPAANRRRVLIVDDNDDARTLLGDILAGLGHEVHVAHDGHSALALVERCDLDVAVLDIGLPGMDGYELAAAIRKRGRGPVQLLAVSGYASTADRERSQAAGFDRYFVKPVDIQQLIAHIAPA